MLTEAFPDYDGGLEEAVEDLSDDLEANTDDEGDDEFTEEDPADEEDDMDAKTAAIKEARKPKMCGFHGELVEYALALEDPASALGSLNPSSYGTAWCKSNEFDGKCNFKP